MITVDEALAAIRGACTPLPEERIPVREALGRVLARPLASDVDWPPFDTSAMDGYAVRLADASRPGATLAERRGLVAAGDPPGAPVAPGEAVRVMTGAPIPPGTEAVVPVEKIRRQDGTVVLEIAPAAGDHVRRRGESVAAGAPLLAPGRRLSAAEVALAALAGADPLAVRSRPRIAVAVTGNELVPTSSTPGPGQLRDSNGPMLAALCASRGNSAALTLAVADEDAAVRRLFREAGADRRVDVLLTTGGVSAGDLDLLPERAERAGFAILFHGVAIRPGKPVAFGKRDQTYWFGLPGNPVSTSVCFHVFVRAALDALEGVGADQAGPEVVTAVLTKDIAQHGRRETYRDARLELAGGEARVCALETKGSHDLAAHARANALIRVPAGAERLTAGSRVECLRL
ncbi:MAG TPA: gephyrin-like molybdotransferase Glp [Thermoanaerobaculia bacterium]|jgi:molybdopterin molybdotransferase